jgi:sterol desaturase/sphingolipid hydroxylase (fatty acid hydroxylase superfamily)
MISDYLGAAFGSLSPSDQITVLTWLLVPAFVAWEVARLNERDRRLAPQRWKETVTGLKFTGGAILVGLVYGFVFAGLYNLASTLAPPQLFGLWRHHPVAAACAAFLLWDMSGFAYHWVGHRTSIGWAAHQVHHTGTEFNASLALRLTWMPWHGLLHHPLIALSGIPISYVLGSLAVSNVLQALQHSQCLPTLPRWVAAMIMTPATHRHHHSEAGAAVNLGPVFTIWDRMAGTWHPNGLPENPAAEFPPRVGVESAWEIQTAGWRQLWRGSAPTDASCFAPAPNLGTIQPDSHGETVLGGPSAPAPTVSGVARCQVRSER